MKVARIEKTLLDGSDLGHFCWQCEYPSEKLRPSLVAVNATVLDNSVEMAQACPALTTGQIN